MEILVKKMSANGDVTDGNGNEEECGSGTGMRCLVGESEGIHRLMKETSFAIPDPIQLQDISNALSTGGRTQTLAQQVS